MDFKFAMLICEIHAVSFEYISLCFLIRSDTNICSEVFF